MQKTHIVTVHFENASCKCLGNSICILISRAEVCFHWVCVHGICWLLLCILSLSLLSWEQTGPRFTGSVWLGVPSIRAQLLLPMQQQRPLPSEVWLFLDFMVWHCWIQSEWCLQQQKAVTGVAWLSRGHWRVGSCLQSTTAFGVRCILKLKLKQEFDHPLYHLCQSDNR